MKTFAFRLKLGQDLKKELEKFVFSRKFDKQTGFKKLEVRNK